MLSRLVAHLGRETVAGPIQDFRAIAPRRLAQAISAATAKDSEALRIAMHQLAGAAAYLGLSELVGIARSIEAASEEKDHEREQRGVEHQPEAIAAAEAQLLQGRFAGLEPPPARPI